MNVKGPFNSPAVYSEQTPRLFGGKDVEHILQSGKMSDLQRLDILENTQRVIEKCSELEKIWKERCDDVKLLWVKKKGLSRAYKDSLKAKQQLLQYKIDLSNSATDIESTKQMISVLESKLDTSKSKIDELFNDKGQLESDVNLTEKLIDTSGHQKSIFVSMYNWILILVMVLFSGVVPLLLIKSFSDDSLYFYDN